MKRFSQRLGKAASCEMPTFPTLWLLTGSALTCLLILTVSGVLLRVEAVSPFATVADKGNRGDKKQLKGFGTDE